MENNDIERLNNTAGLGEPKSTYRIKFSAGYFFPHVLSLFCGVLGVAIFAGATGWKAYVAAPFMAFLLFPLAFLLWRTLSSLRDELTVFEKGFIYRSRPGLQTCRWEQIADHTDILDIGDRLKITSVEKKGGEKITFAYKMRGLDVLFHDLSEYEYAEIPDSEKATEEDIAAQPKTLGALVGTFRVKYSFIDLWPIFLLLFPAFFGVACIFALKDIAAKILCPIPLMFPLILYLWQGFAEWSDEMSIYENGFAYRSRKGSASCLWDEIEDYSVAGRGSVVSAIKKDDGTWIHIAMEMQGVEDNLRPHLRTVIKWTGPEE